MLEFLKEHPRKIESKEKVDISLLPTMLLSRKQNFLYQNTKWTNPQERVKVNEREFEYGWHEYGAYIGFVPLVLAMVGVFFYFRQHLSLLIIGVLSLWISLGESAFYNLWGLLHKFPIYASLHVPSRFILGFIFCISIFAGLGLSKLESISRRKYYKLLISIIIGTVFFDLFLVNRHLLRSAFIIKPPRVDVCSEFRQRYINFDLFPEKSRSSMYPVFLSNSGIINSYEVVGVKKGNVKVIGELDYKGEAYIAGAKGDTLISYFSPNKILVNVKIKGSDILVVNQNFYRGWKVLKHGIRYAADSYNGLIATAVDQNDKIVTFYYMPISFLFGSIITSISFLSGTIFCIKLLKRCA